MPNPEYMQVCTLYKITTEIEKKFTCADAAVFLNRPFQENGDAAILVVIQPMA